MNTYKKQMARLLSAALVLLLLLTPLPAKAGSAWQPQPLPALSVDTVFGDGRYINPAWLSQKVTITYQGKIWDTGMNAFQNVPVRLTNNNGKIACTFLDSAVFDAFFSAINADLAAMTLQTDVPLYDNGAGSYVIQKGQMYTQAVASMSRWLQQTLENLILTGHCSDIEQELTPQLLTTATANSSLALSPDYQVLGTCTTSFATSDANRSSNVAVAASRFQDFVVMPGQTVSVSDTFLPRTKANGYKPAGVYANGVHTTGMGGGVCQVSSTIYNAVKNANLTVTERRPHSMPVSYLPHGLDAAIAAGSKDLKFRNDYAVPVVIRTHIANKHLTVDVLVPVLEQGGRTYKLWAKQVNHLTAKTYFTTYQNGVESGTVFVGTTKYSPYKEG